MMYLDAFKLFTRKGFFMTPDEVKAQLLCTMYNARSSEVQSRSNRRDALVALALVVGGSAAIAAVDVWALLAVPIPLRILGAVWMRHDQRIGHCAYYMCVYLEPAMKELGGPEGFEAVLDQIDRNRSSDSISRLARLVPHSFAIFQAATIGIGLLRYALSAPQSSLATSMVIAMALVGVAITVLTWIDVKHERLPTNA